MLLRILNKEEIKQIYETKMQDDFPAAELKPLSEIYRMIDAGNYEVRGFYKDDELLAYVFISFAVRLDVALIDYLAVCSKFRSKGIGSKLISAIRKEMAKWKGVILEVENPEFAENDADYNIQCRRIAFYEKNDIVLSDVKTTVFGVPFRIMYFSDFLLEECNIRRSIDDIYHAMFPKSTYDKAVRFNDEYSDIENNYSIRMETKSDWNTTEYITREAFWNVYRPGCMEHYVLHCYRSLPEFIPELSLVLEVGGKIVAHIMYSKGELKADDGGTIPIMIFGPVSVLPKFQGKGLGSKLIRYSLDKAKTMGCGAVAITGNPDYYHSFGFVSGQSLNVFYGDNLRGEDTPFFMVKELRDGFLDGFVGTYTDPPGYFVTDEDVDAFDQAFEPKEKKKLPGQLV